MAKPNYAFAKRQRDLAKKQKKEEKKLRKAGPATDGVENAPDQGGGEPGDQPGEQAAAGDRDPGQQATKVAGEAADAGRQSGQA